MVGIYFWHSSHENAEEQHRYFYNLSFTDWLPGGRRTFPVMRLARYSVADGKQSANHKFMVPLEKGEPPPAERPPTGSWIKLAIEVTPERIIAYEGKRKIGEIAARQLSDNADVWLKQYGHVPGVLPGIVPQGALGLYINRGAARFRSVRIEPLPE
jgi:hypothetical protein